MDLQEKSFIRLMVSEGSLFLCLPCPFGSVMRQSVLAGAVVERKPVIPWLLGREGGKV